MSRPTLPPSPPRTSQRARPSAHTPKCERQKPTHPRAASEKRRGGETTHVPPPLRHKRTHHPRQHQETQTPTRTRAVAQTPNPATHRANTPTSKPKLPPPREHKSAHTNTCGRGSVSAGTRGRVGDRHEAKQAKPPQSGHAEASAHKASAQTMGFAPKRCRPAPARRGVRRERKAAHNSPRRGAWVVVFVGVFADVCRLFEDCRFGCLGVFWGCLACFLVF